MKIPGFIARSFYVGGSLRNTDHGFQMQAHNPMGDGVIVGVGQMRVDGKAIAPETVTAQRPGDPAPIKAADVSRTNPVHVKKGDRVTLHVDGEPLAAGEHQLEVELIELNLGQLSFTISDSVTLAGADSLSS